MEALFGWLVSWSIYEGEGIQRKKVVQEEEALLNSESEEERR